MYACRPASGPADGGSTGAGRGYACARLAFLREGFYFYDNPSIPMKIWRSIRDSHRHARTWPAAFSPGWSAAASPRHAPLPRWSGWLAGILLPLGVVAQPLVNINYGNLNFPDANRVHKKGVLGQTAGSRTLYRNVAVVNGQAIDCIVTTMSLTNGRFEYPTGFCPGTIPFDFREPQNCPKPDTPAVTLRSNEDRFFCPTFFFETGGGSCRFKFEFIVGGSYSDAADRGSPVILRNVLINSYDIDGNADCSWPNPASNQFNDFSGFNSAARATPGSRITTSYNPATGMTRFMSISHCNITDVKDPTTRIRIEYQYLQEFEVEVGMTGRGRAFYMLDFGPGPAFTPMMLYTPVLDLNTLGSGDGYNNVATLCSTPERVSRGDANIVSLNNSIEEMIIAVPAADIRDGNAEFLTTDITTPAQHILLGTPFSGSQALAITGTAYTVTRTVTSAGMRQMRFTKNGGHMTNAEAEKLLDALVYFNTVNSPGLRRFTIWLKEGVVTSTFAFFEVYGGCIVLSASAPRLEALAVGGRVRLSWRLQDPVRVVRTGIERASGGGADWVKVYERAALAADLPGLPLEHHDVPRPSGVHRYRLVETDLFGVRQVSAERVVRVTADEGPAFFPNPVVNGWLTVVLDHACEVSVYDARGIRMFGQRLGAGLQRIDVGRLPAGRYTLVSERRASPLLVQ